MCFLVERPLGKHRVQAGQRVLDVADDRQVRLAVLVELGRVDVDVDDRAVLAELLELAGHAVVEAHPEGEQQVRAVLRSSPSGR